MLKFYNTLGRKKQEFRSIKKGQVTMYTCGPTVYWLQHIGNMRAYVFADVLKRVLMFNDYRVKHVINITDVGHLTSDADTGEDKIEKAAKKEGKSAQDIAEYYFKIFHEDLGKLNVIDPAVWCKATEYIKEQIALVKRLEEKGFTYKTSDGIYFDTSKLKNYGELARLNVENLKAGARVEIGQKKNKTDFALWKFSEEQGVRQQEWDSPWGLGFPGWHIECSAMAMKNLGETIDIHTGGEDHIGVHHTNEIAQSEAATGKKFCNFWMHVAFLTFKGEKVSKSKGGLFTLSELEEKGFRPLDYRYFCLTAKYRSKLDFSLENLENMKNTYTRLKNIIDGLDDDKKVNENYLKEFTSSVNDDLDTPKALAVLWKMLRDTDADGKIGAIKKMDSVLGLGLLKKEEVKVPKEIMNMVDEREKARADKDFERADVLRDKITKKGFVLEDSKEGVKVKKA